MSACARPLDKANGDKYECSSFRGIRLLSVVGKVHGRALTKWVRFGKERMLGDEQCGFRTGRRCMTQETAVRQVCVKYLDKGEEVFWVFMDLEKTYNKSRKGGIVEYVADIWYCIGLRLPRAVKNS